MTTPPVSVASSIKVCQSFGYAPVAVLAAVVVVATLTLRDLLFALLGCAGLGLAFAAVQKERLAKQHAKSRLLIRFDEVKRNFRPLIEQVESSYARDSFFVNNYSRGLYQHVTFEEQLDIVKWVEAVEQKLQLESKKQFEDFERSLAALTDAGVAKPLAALEVAEDREAGSPSTLAAEVSLRDTSHEMALIDSVSLRQADEKVMRELFADIKGVLADFYRSTEDAYGLWGELNNQTMDKIFKYFSASSEESPRQLALFSLAADEMFESAPSLLGRNAALLQFLDGCVSAREAERRIFGFDWDMLRTKITGENSGLIEKNARVNKENMDAFARLSREALDNLGRTAANIRELREYFATTKQKLADVQREFGQRMAEVKLKIAAFKQQVEKCEDYELQLKLEYEIRLEISRLYKLKHSHESECVGLDKRLDELEAFNTSTELVHSLLNTQVIQFFEKCEDKMLLQVRDAALLRLASLLSCDVGRLRVEQGDAASRQIADLYRIELDSPVSESQFKDFLVSNVLDGKACSPESFDPQKHVSLSAEMASLAAFIDSMKSRLAAVRATIETFELDDRNEFEEAILIKRVPGIQKISLKPDEQATADDSALKVEMEVRSDKDWTHNRPKAKQLADSVEKMAKTLEQIFKIYEASLNSTTANEAKINKLLAKQNDQTLKVYLCRRLMRTYFGERLCLGDLTEKLKALIELLGHVRQQLAWLWKTFYEDESVDKLISVATKQDIFGFLQEAKAIEVQAKALTMHCICTHLFKQFETVQVLLADKYPSFQSHASMDDLHSWQQTIRKGSKRMVLEEEPPQQPKSPCKSPRGNATVEELQTTPRKESDSKESPYAHSGSPVRSSKK